jgi:Mn-dependent DtxR family transcriptional regulator
VAELDERLPASPLTAAEILADLARQGVAEKGLDGRWRLTERGGVFGRALLQAGEAA